jgi:hypothetical protein
MTAQVFCPRDGKLCSRVEQVEADGLYALWYCPSAHGAPGSTGNLIKKERIGDAPVAAAPAAESEEVLSGRERRARALRRKKANASG